MVIHSFVDLRSYMDEQYFNVKATYTDEDEWKPIEALGCFLSGYDTILHLFGRIVHLPFWSFP
jgi:hypothetical protein